MFYSLPFCCSQPLAGLPLDNPSFVVHDNDDHRDVYTDEYLLALSHLGDIELSALITTYSPNRMEYGLFVKGREKIVEKAGLSGMKGLPVALEGTHQRLERPSTNRISDTGPLGLPASRYLVGLSRSVTKERPLVFVTGGQLTVIADAYLIDTTIVDRVIVTGIFGVREMDYNAGLDAWAWKIVLSRFRVLAVPIGPPGRRGRVYMKPPEVDKARIASGLPQDIPFFDWMYRKGHPGNGLPDGHDHDGQAAIPIIRPDYTTKVKRWSVKRIDSKGGLILDGDDNGNIYEALDADQDIATKEFWRAMVSLSDSIQ